MTKAIFVRAIAVGALAVSFAAAQVVWAQDTTVTAELTVAPDTLTAEQEAAAAEGAGSDAVATQTIVLLGEKVSVENPESAKGPFADLVNLTTSTLGGKVVDLTTHGLTIAQTAETVPDALRLKPDVAIVFTGYTDEKAETPAKPEDGVDVQRQKLGELAETLKKSGAKVFLVPASTNVGALAGANLRLVASDLDISYVSMGTEVGGQPFQDAFDAIRDELNSPAVEEPASTPTPAPKVATINQGTFAPQGATSSTEQVRKSMTSIQEELDRVAGQASDAPTLTQMSTETLLAADTQTSDSKTTIPVGGKLTKRGAEAQENINMRPLPAVKAFRPQIPVPRNQVDEKEPALSR